MNGQRGGNTAQPNILRHQVTRDGEPVQSHIIEMLAGFHDVRSPLCLVDLHPALTEELPAG